jgi:tight adherence protein B
MRRVITLIVLSGLFALMAVGAALGQTAPDQLELRIEEAIVAEHPEVTLVVSVPRELVGKNLTADAFTVTESGQERPVVVNPVPTDGLQVVLVLDASTSMSGAPITAAKDAAQSFLEAMPDGVEVAAVSFASTPAVLSAFTTDKATISAAVEGLTVGGETALYDGLVAASELFGDQDSNRRTVVVLSDGGDTVSGGSLVEAFESLNASEVAFYAVELQSPENDSAGLARLATETEGLVVPAGDPSALTQVFNDVAAQIVNRYELTFSSEAFGRSPLVVTAEADGVVATVTEGVRYPDPPAPPTTLVETAPVPTTVVAATPSTPREPTLVELQWWESSAALWLGAGAVFLAIAALLTFMGIAQKRDVRLVASNVRQRFGQTKKTALSSLAEQATLLAERTVDRDHKDGGLGSRLEKAGLQLRTGEYVVLNVAAATVVGALVTALANPLFGLMGLALTPLLFNAWLSQRVSKRQKAFADQLTDVLQLLSGSVRSGFGMMQAVDTVAREVAAPAGDEFQRVKIEVQLGRDSNDALRAMARRVGSEDFEWVVEAMEIHREVGGDLANILDSVTETVRDRNRIRRRVETLSAEGKFTGIVLTALPLVLGLAVSVLNPAYISELTTTGIGQVLIAVGVFAMLVGVFWMRKITSLKY